MHTTFTWSSVVLLCSRSMSCAREHDGAYLVPDAAHTGYRPQHGGASQLNPRSITTVQVPNPNVDLELDELDLEECIGRGGHGAVYKARAPEALRQAARFSAASDSVQSVYTHNALDVRSVHTAGDEAAKLMTLPPRRMRC